MDEQIPTFLAVTGVEDEAIAKQYLELTNGDLEYAVTLYMESQPPAHSAPAADSHTDEQIAERLQQEAYGSGGGEDEVRSADANVHRHETLVDSFNFGDSYGFMNQPQSRPQDIFGSGRVGIFNQRFDDEEDQYYRNRIEVLDEDDEDDEDYNEDLGHDNDEGDIIIIDSDEDDNVEPISRRRRNRDARQAELTSTQRRLASLFRPPFDIISTMSLDAAKVKAKEENKWILINIQDASEFQSQVLNRDFWSSTKIKSIVREEFVFLQYQKDSPNGSNYLNFYSTDGFPHIAILDPLTGERVFKWTDGEVPKVDEWSSDVEDFLSKFSLLPNSNNPMVKHEVKFDPDALSEDQQIEFALKQSISENRDRSATPASEPVQEVVQTQEPEEPEDLFNSIKPVDHTEPTTGSTTRIQIRFPNGKRVVHKFELSDTILTIYQWLKFLLDSHPDEYGISGQDRFNISNTSNRSFKFTSSFAVTIEEANLKNASLLLEKQ